MSTESIEQDVSQLMKEKKWGDACEVIRQHPQEHDESFKLSWNLGWALYNLGRYDAAAAELEKVVEKWPGNPVGRWALAQVYAELERVPEAEREFLRAIALRDSTIARSGLGFLYHRIGRVIEAEGIYREGIRLKPNDAERIGTLADFLDDLGRKEEAAEYYARAEQAGQAGDKPPRSAS